MFLSYLQQNGFSQLNGEGLVLLILFIINNLHLNNLPVKKRREMRLSEWILNHLNVMFLVPSKCFSMWPLLLLKLWCYQMMVSPKTKTGLFFHSSVCSWSRWWGAAAKMKAVVCVDVAQWSQTPQEAAYFSPQVLIHFSFLSESDAMCSTDTTKIVWSLKEQLHKSLTRFPLLCFKVVLNLPLPY